MRVCAMLAVLSLLVGCGGSGPSGDEGKTVAQVQEAAKAADTSMIESIIAEYETAIASHEDELKELQEKIAEAGGKALDGLLGEEKSDDVKGDLESLKADAESLAATLADLKEKLGIYVQELASR